MESEKSSAVELKSGLTARALGIGILWVIVSIIWQTVFWALSTVPIGNMPGAEQLTGLPVVGIFFSFITILIGNVALSSKLRFTKQEQTVVYAMVLLSGAPVGMYQGWFYLTATYGIRRTPNDVPLSWIPSHIVPLKEFVDPALTGRVAVPWGAVAGFMTTFILTFCLWGFYGLISGFILRRQLIEIQRLPFPYATPAIELINQTEEVDGKPALANFKLGRTKALWAGIAVGFLCYFYWLLNALAPSIFPVPWSYTWEGGFFWNLDGAPINLWTVLPQVMGCFWLNPELIAFAYLVPTDILLSAGWGWWIFTWLVPIIEDALAITPKYAGATHCYSPYWFYGMSNGIRHALAFDWGGILGLGIAMIVLNAKYLARTLKGPRESGESEKEGMSYRTMWLILFIIFIIFFVYLVAWAGFSAPIAVFFLVYLFIFFFGSTYMKGEAGPQEWYWYWNQDDMVSAAVLFGTAKFPLAEGPQTAISEAVTYRMVLGYPCSNQVQCISLEGLKVADATKTKPRDMLVAYAITIPLMNILAIILCVWIAYTFGLTKLRIPVWNFGDVYRGFYNQPAGYLPDAAKMPFFAWGFIATILLLILRTRFVWFPVHPAGIVVGVGADVKAGPAFWVAWFLKFVTLRIGGTGLYNKVVPFAVGVGIGAVLLRIIHALVVSGITLSIGI
jgi:hypothetical protein